jgi:uncharacterized RmlC-like cupin family protein
MEGPTSDTVQATQSGQAGTTCRIIHPDDTYAGLQGLTSFSGIASETVGAQGICMHLLRMPPGVRANAHLHEQHETASYLISGEVEMWYGEELREHMVMDAGEFLDIPAGMPHLPYNASDTEAVAVLARIDPNKQESVVLLPHLDNVHE